MSSTDGSSCTQPCPTGRCGTSSRRRSALAWITVLVTGLVLGIGTAVWAGVHGSFPMAIALALLHAAGHLLAWGQTRWEELGEYGWKDRLRFLWLWGSGQGLGRLV